MRKEQKNAALVLADGTVYHGFSFGAEGTAIGEVVFTTGVVGYQETLTDPSLFGQLVIQTFPLIGNYGVNGEDGESDRCHFRGYIAREWCEMPSNFRMSGNIDDYLRENQVVGICGIDTRALTRKIREDGVMNGMVTTQPLEGHMEEILAQLAAYRSQGAVASVACTEMQTFETPNARYRVALLDFGHKRSTRRWLQKLGCTVLLVPPTTTAAQIAALGVDGVMLSGGPGDPTENPEIVENLRQLSTLGIPVLGACLGHQLMALAQGAQTAKMKYGHRGGNQPVTDLDTGHTFITGQNHGYVVLGETLPAQVGHVSHSNANDKTCEGIRYTAFPCVTVQFYPESCTGPRDTDSLFYEFAKLMDAHKEDAVCR